MERADNQIVMQIVALLFSFASLAQRASGRSWPVRCLVLSILRCAEPIARDYALSDGVPALAPVRIHRDGGNELARLSLRFRVLALTLLVAAARSLRLPLLLNSAPPASPVDDVNFADVFADRAWLDTS
jgi:hypothetical protein